jgi:DNA-binding transcriptional regulator YbjK
MNPKNKLKKWINAYLKLAQIDRNRDIYTAMNKGILEGKSISSVLAELAVKYTVSTTRIRMLDKQYAEHLARVALQRKLEGQEKKGDALSEPTSSEVTKE